MLVIYLSNFAEQVRSAQFSLFYPQGGQTRDLLYLIFYLGYGLVLCGTSILSGMLCNGRKMIFAILTGSLGILISIPELVLGFNYTDADFTP